MRYLAKPSDAALERLARLPAVGHLLEHAVRFDQPVPRSTSAEMVRHLIARLAGNRETIEGSADFFSGALLADPRWVADALRYLPSEFRFRGSLFLVAGYDIGVALAPHASLNAGHLHFARDPRELLYYAIHELHHVGFMTYSSPPRFADLRTCADLVSLVDYSTALKGTAVLAALDRRTSENALDHDEDYVALGDERRMREYETRYAEDHNYLRRRGADPMDDGHSQLSRACLGATVFGTGRGQDGDAGRGSRRAAGMVTRLREGRDLRRAPRCRSAV